MCLRSTRPTILCVGFCLNISKMFNVQHTRKLFPYGKWRIIYRIVFWQLYIYIFLKQCVSAIQGQGGALGLSFEIRQCVWSEGIVIRWCGRFDDRQHVSCGTPCIGGLFLESVDPFSGCRPNRKVSFNQVFLRGDPVWLHLSTMSRKQVFLLLCDLL